MLIEMRVAEAHHTADSASLMAELLRSITDHWLTMNPMEASTPEVT